VAVGIGYFLGGEALGLRTALGTVFILASVIAIAAFPSAKPSFQRREQGIKRLGIAEIE